MRTDCRESSPPRRAEELIVYLADRSESDPAFDVAKLSRLLFHADFTAYVRFGNSISGGEYRQEAGGPTLVGLNGLLEDLSHRGAVALRDVPDGLQRRVVGLRPATLDVFTPGEIDVVNRAIERARGLCSRETGDRLCDFPAVELAADGELIPYEIALVARRRLTASETRRGAELSELAVNRAELATHAEDRL